MGNAGRGQHRPEVFEGVNKVLQEREPHRGIGPNKFFVLMEVRANVWGST